MYRIEETPELGGLAPDFALRDQNGKEVRLSSYRGRVATVLAFYRGASDPYSMRWLAELNDDYLLLRGSNVEVLAISTDAVDKAKDTATRYKMPFKLLSDPGKVAIRAYGVFDEMTGGALAAAFIIDAAGMVRYRHVGKVPSDMPSVEEMMGSIRAVT